MKLKQQRLVNAVAIGGKPDVVRTSRFLSRHTNPYVEGALLTGCVSIQKKSLGKTGRGRNWNYESSKPHIHRVVDRSTHGIAASSCGVGEGGGHAWAKIVVLSVGYGCGCISASVDLTCCFDGGAARPLLHGIVKASNEKETDTQRDRADKQGDKYGRNNRKFYRCGAPLVEPQDF